MLLSAQEISLARERLLNTQLALSLACIESARQLTLAAAAAGRAGLQQGGEHCARLPVLAPEQAAQRSAALVLDQAARAGRLFREAVLVVGEMQKTVIRCSEMQVRIFDAMAVAAIERIRKTSPWEAEPTLDAWTESLATTERALRELSGTAIETIERLENGISDASYARPGGLPSA